MKQLLIILSSILCFSVSKAQNIGIGTSTPGARLQVVGTGVSGASSTLILKNAGVDTLFRVMDNGNTTIGYNGGIYPRTLSLGGNGVNFYTPGNGPYQGGIYPSSSGNSLVVSGSNHLILQAEAGNVGIANINPQYRLDVGGIIHSNNNAYVDGTVAIGTTSPNNSAALEINSTNKGILFPRVADTSSIASPAKGLVIFSNAGNRLWYYDGSRWQSTAGSGSAYTDSLWYKANDSITYSSSDYVGINTDINLFPPQTNLDVNGGFLVQGLLKHTNALPTVSQVYTMNNTAGITSITSDSVFRVYDPGGTGNYLNNTQGNVSCSTAVAAVVGFRVNSVAADFGIGTGDTLWVSKSTFPACRTNYIYRYTNTTVNPADFSVNGTFYLLFRANADGNNGKGFNFVMTALYHSDNHRKILAVGPSMYFDGGDGSFGAGYGTEPTGNSSVAIGLFTKSSASGAAAFGAYANASGQYSVALGNGAFATGYGATALGISSKASGDFSIAIGYDCETLNDYAIAMGYNTQASGQSSTSMGYSTQATGSYSSSAGIGTLARGFAGTVVGMYNFPVTASQTSVSSSTPLFIVGNGDDASNRSNALLVTKNGNIGIGSDLPSEQLVINGSGASTIQLQNNYIDKGFVQLSGNNLRVGTYSSNSTGNFIVRTNGSDQLTIFPSGNATLAGTLTQNSDARFKQNIEPLTGSLEKLLHLNGYQYYWKTGLKKDEKKQIGLIAQNVESVYPELVNTNAEGMKSVAYQNLVPVLIEAIKEQQIQINKLTTTIDQLLKNK